MLPASTAALQTAVHAHVIGTFATLGLGALLWATFRLVDDYIGTLLWALLIVVQSESSFAPLL